MYYIDVETCGFHGVPVTIQWAKDDGEIFIHEVWRVPMQETLELIEMFCEDEVCGFNLTFDWFHLFKIYTMFCLYPDKQVCPDGVIHELAVIEERARFVNICIKPKAVLDLMLHARKGPFQSLMEREDIRIRRIPTPLAWPLAKELGRRIYFDDIYFANAKDKEAPRWKVYDIKKPDGTYNPDFKDIKLKFKASGSLKNLYRHIFKIKNVLSFKDVEVPKEERPEEKGFAPFALALRPNAAKDKDWGDTWPAKIRAHIRHWAFMSNARTYAKDDITYTRAIHRYFLSLPNPPKPGDTDSELTVMVAVCRWRGFAIDKAKLKALRDRAIERKSKIPTAPGVVKKYLLECMDQTETLALQEGTSKAVLTEISRWETECSCLMPTLCSICHGKGLVRHPAAIRAEEVLLARASDKEIELYDKLLLAGRFHASFKVIGTLSSRMAGSDGLNAQGIKHQTYVRECFPLADTEDVLKGFGFNEEQIETLKMSLSGGDFKSFEVTIACAVFKDPALDAAMKSGKKVHALLGMELFPPKTYEEILASEGSDDDMYDKGKKGFFLMIYGGDENTFKLKLSIPLEIGQPAMQRFLKKHKKILEFNETVQKDFGALDQSGGLGTRIEWREPKDYAESFLGFRRYFTLENKICRALFELAQKPPKEWKDIQVKVMRRDRVQTASGATQSALYGAAFGIISGIIRAAKNHYIQSPGAEITKATQRAIWSLQPSGATAWRVMAINIHDELMAPNKNLESEIRAKVNGVVTYYKTFVPLLAIDWIDGIPNWAGKKGVKNVAALPDKSAPADAGPPQYVQANT